MGYTIRKRFTFAAAHHLEHLPPGHKCGRLHGHNYTVWLELTASTLDPAGFVRDFGDLTEFKAAVEALDHRDLNDLVEDNPTAENLARHLFDLAAGAYGPLAAAVAVEETGTCWAEYRP